MSTTKNKILFSTLTIILMLTIIFLFEWIIQHSLPLNKKRHIYMKTRNVFQYNEKNVEFDSILGYRNKSNLETSFSNLEFSTQIRTNSQGFRDDEDALTTADLWLVGDSFGFGWGVEKEELIDTIVERSCRTKIANMSTSGYGTLQEYLLIKNQLQQHNKKPKWIIFLFYSSNDLLENLGYGLDIYPTLNLDKETLKLPQKETLYRWLTMCQSQFYPSFYGRYTIPYYLHFLFDYLSGKISPPSPLPPEILGKELEMLNKISLLIQKLSQIYNIPILFVSIPAVTTYEELDSSETHRAIHAIFYQHKFYEIDLKPALTHSDYFTLDDHWNSGGHKKAARELVNFFKKVNLCQ